MTRRIAALAVAGLMGTLVWVAAADAAVDDVRVGNFYFEDATFGDGQIVITAGDQIRFIVEDNGPGTPHTIDIDAFGVHSGNLAKGETFTTGTLDTPGTYVLYCSLHLKRNHITTLIVLDQVGAPTATITTTTLAVSTTTTAAPATTTLAGSTTTSPTDTGDTTPPDSTGTDPTATEEPPPSSDEPEVASGLPWEQEPDAGDADSSDSGGDAEIAETGRGQIDLANLTPLPTNPDSLAALLGRQPATDAPWTRAVRQSALALIPLMLLSGLALLRHQRSLTRDSR